MKHIYQTTLSLALLISASSVMAQSPKAANAETKQKAVSTQTIAKNNQIIKTYVKQLAAQEKAAAKK